MPGRVGRDPCRSAGLNLRRAGGGSGGMRPMSPSYPGWPAGQSGALSRAEGSVNGPPAVALIWARREDAVEQGNRGPPARSGLPGRDARSDSVVDTSAPRAYTSWWQARSDAWSRLEEASGQLPATALAGQAADETLETTSGLLDALAQVEQYWAFPGPEAHRRVRDLFASGNYGRFALLVARITRALVTESYRAGTGWAIVDSDYDETEPDETAAGHVSHDRPGRPYFE